MATTPEDWYKNVTETAVLTPEKWYSQITAEPEEEKPWWQEAWEGEVEALKVGPENLAKSIEWGVRQFDPKNLAAFPSNLGDLWMWIARQMPEQQDFAETWAEATTEEKAVAGAQVVSLAGLITILVAQGITGVNAIRTAYRMWRNTKNIQKAEELAKMGRFEAIEKVTGKKPYIKVETFKGKTRVFGGKVVERGGIPRERLPLADTRRVVESGWKVPAEPTGGPGVAETARGITGIRTRAAMEFMKNIPKATETVGKNWMRDELERIGASIAKEIAPKVELTKAFETAREAMVPLIKDLPKQVDVGAAETIANEFFKVLVPMANQLATGIEPTIPIPEGLPETPEEKIVEEELAKPLTKVPPTPPTPPPSEIPQFGEEPGADPIVRLNELIKRAKPVRAKLEKAYTLERAKRIGEVERFIEETIDTVGGEEGYRMILGKLKGELVSPEAKVRFEPVKEKLTEEELKSLYVRTWKHPYLDNWEKISAADGLTDLLMGGIPQPKKLVLLEEIYGSELIKNILSKRVWGAKVTDILVEAGNIPRALLATADMSAFLRQGVIEIAAHPVISAKAIGKTFEFAFKPETFQQYFKDLPKDKLYPLIRKSGLSITDPAKAGRVEREEAFISRFLQKVPIVKTPILFAERAYVGFLNKLRVDIFKTWADELLSRGYSPVKDIELFKAAADTINTFTGRGSLGPLNRITPELNTLFFSPRLIAARFNALNPIWYAKQPKEIRKKALGDFGKFVVAGLTTLAMIKLAAGDKVSIETDPRSSDFGKIRIGNTRYDIWGGFQQWARVFTQVIMGERKNTTTGEIISLNKDEYPFTTRYETVLRFIEGKLAPVPQLVRELMTGAKTFGGEDITPEVIAKEKFIPMYIQDIAEAYMDGGLGRAVGTGPVAFFGVGVQTWEPRKKEAVAGTGWFF